MGQQERIGVRSQVSKHVSVNGWVGKLHTAARRVRVCRLICTSQPELLRVECEHARRGAEVRRARSKRVRRF